MVADTRSTETELSVIYRWNRRRRQFLRYQTLETHAAQDWEAFQIHNHSFLVVANHRRGELEVDHRRLGLASDGSEDLNPETVLKLETVLTETTSEPPELQSSCFFFCNMFLCNQMCEMSSCGVVRSVTSSQEGGDEDLSGG